MSAEVSHQIQEDDVAGVCENDQRFETMDQCIVNRKKRYERGFPDARAVVSVADGPAMVFLPGNGSTVVVTMGFINATHANSASLPVLHQGIILLLLRADMTDFISDIIATQPARFLILVREVP